MWFELSILGVWGSLTGHWERELLCEFVRGTGSALLFQQVGEAELKLRVRPAAWQGMLHSHSSAVHQWLSSVSPDKLERERNCPVGLQSCFSPAGLASFSSESIHQKTRWDISVLQPVPRPYSISADSFAVKSQFSSYARGNCSDCSDYAP